MPAESTTAPAESEQNDASVETLISLWLAGRSPLTQAAYRESVARFRAHVARPLAQVTMEDVQAWADHLETAPARGGRPLAPASRGRAYAAVRSLYAFGVRYGRLPHDPTGALRTPKGRDTLAQRILSEDEVRRLIAAAPDARGRALLRLLYGGALRISEACGLRWRDVQPRGQGAQLAVWGKGSKSRYVIVSGAVLDALRAVQPAEPDPEAPVLGGMTRQDGWAVVKAAARAAGISGDASPHWLRHSHASHALDRGAPISLVRDSLGHTNLATTSRYLHARPADGSGRYLPD